MITKRNYLPTVCIVYTILSLGKLLFEAFFSKPDSYYTLNFLFMFAIVSIATFVLGMHQFLKDIPLLFVMIGQYLVVVGTIMLFMFIASFYIEVNPGGYKDMFISVTIPYIILAGIYYLTYFREIKKANELLKLINEDEL